MHRGGPETAGAGLPWPDAPQEQLLRTAIGPDAGVREAFTRWQALTDLELDLDGGTFRLLPLVYLRTSALKFDDAVMARLKGVYRLAWVETHTLLNATTPALKALVDAGIPVLLLKGVPLALQYYASHAARPMSDLDIVVAPADVPRALAALRQTGWEATQTLRPGSLAYGHAMGLRDSSGQERVDLHWHCLRELLYDSADAWFWKSAQPLDVAGIPVLQPSPTAMLLHTIIHGTRSNIEPPIRWVADAHTIIKTSGDAIDWMELSRFARRHKLSHRLYLGLDYLATGFGVPVPAALLEDLQSASRSTGERLENLRYLRDVNQNWAVRLFADYWRYHRHAGALRLLQGLPDFLVFRWHLGSKTQLPAAIVRKSLRKLGLGRERGAQQP